MAVVAVCLLIGTVFCDATVYLETWDSGTSGWQIKSEFEGAAEGTLANSSGYLSISASPGSAVLTDIIFADSSADGSLIETHFSTQAIFFTFYSNMDPTYLYAYVKGTNVSGGDILWLNELSSTAGSKYVQLGYDSGNGWENMLAASTLADWTETLTKFDEVGIAIWYPGDAGQEYGIDNFTIDAMIPEPETWLMLGFALLSITITFRQQINEAVVKVRSDT